MHDTEVSDCERENRLGLLISVRVIDDANDDDAQPDDNHGILYPSIKTWLRVQLHVRLRVYCVRFGGSRTSGEQTDSVIVWWALLPSPREQRAPCSARRTTRIARWSSRERVPEIGGSSFIQCDPSSSTGHLIARSNIRRKIMHERGFGSPCSLLKAKTYIRLYK